MASNVTLDPTIKTILSELGRSQKAVDEYNKAGRGDLAQNAVQYMGQVIHNAQANKIDVGQYGNQGRFDQYYQGGSGPAGVYNPQASGVAPSAGLGAPHLSSLIDPNGRAMAGAFQATAALPATAPTTTPPTTTAPTTTQTAKPLAPPTNTLPSSTNTGQQVMNYTQPATVDWNAIRGRASNDAKLQIDALRQQAQQNFGRFQSDGQSQVDKLNAMYAPQYEQNKLNTVGAARDAVQQVSNNGFFASGLQADASLKAQLEGERQRMALQGQQTSQVGEIQNRMNLSQQELGDMLQNLSGRETQLVQSLMDTYGKDERSFDLQNRGLSSDIALRMLGMDQSYNQFNQGLSWDQNKFSQQLGENNTQRQWQSGENQNQRQWQGNQNVDQRTWQGGENQSQRDWTGGQNVLDRQNRTDLANLDAKTRTDLQVAEQKWRSGEASLDRGNAQEQYQTELGLKKAWQEFQIDQGKSQFQWQKDESTADRNTRTKAANSQWMAFADQALQAGKWKSLDQATKELDSYSGRIISDGADMSGIYDYIKKRMKGNGQSLTNPLNMPGMNAPNKGLSPSLFSGQPSLYDGLKR